MSSAPAGSVPLLDRLAGAVAARWPAALRRLGDWESRSLREEIAAVAIDRPVYICGLARAGTTVLLEAMAAVPGFTSHRYSDFAGLWTPYWWNWLHARLPLPARAPTERAHRDRIAVTPDSPEAFEEPLWMHFFPDRHATTVDQTLDKNTANDAFDAFYIAHVRKLLAIRHAQRYVAKGNYNLTRIGYLLRLFPDAKFLIAVREPLAHVASLVKQDRLFSSWAERDPAVARHLARCGHFEFGPHKRVVNTGDEAAARQIEACFREGRLAEGYARQWASNYGSLAMRLDADPRLAAACLLISYENFCAHSAQALAAIYHHAGVDADVADLMARQNSAKISQPDYYEPDLTCAECDQVMDLTRGSQNRLLSLRNRC